MLTITVPAGELWDEVNEEYLYTKEQTLELEHSLVSLSKWESKWSKPFLNCKKTRDELIDYARCMTINRGVDPKVYMFLTQEQVTQIGNYIDSPMTATTFKKGTGSKGRSEILTSELIYYYMISLSIPFECQKWHLNRLMTLIHICTEKNQPPRKMSTNEILSNNAALNAERKKKFNTRG